MTIAQSQPSPLNALLPMDANCVIAAAAIAAVTVAVTLLTFHRVYT